MNRPESTTHQPVGPGQRRHPARMLAGLLAVGFLVAGCGGPAPVEPEPTTTTLSPTTTTTSTTSTTSTTTTTTVVFVPAEAGKPFWPPYQPVPGTEGIAPLTGLAVDPTVGSRPVLAVKIDNAPKARGGQRNLQQADVVFEENVEGVTRFIALFQSRQPDEIGPIRSARTSDLDVLAGLNRPILAWSGGNDGVTSWVEAAANAGALVNASAFKVGGCYRRSDHRPKPHNLMVDPTCVRERRGDGGPARSLWTFHTAGVRITGEPATDIRVTMDGVKVTWVWDPAAGRYLRSQNGEPHLADGGTQISATNVIVANVGYVPSRVDARSPEAITTGSGTVLVYTDGVLRRGRWSRGVNTDTWVLTADDGQIITLAPGTTWLHLARG